VKIVRLTRKLWKSFQNPKIEIKKNDKTFFVTTKSIRWKNFWEKRYTSGDWEPYTFQVLDTFLDSNHSYIDIGAWIGPTVLYGCQLAKHCYAFEPDPIAFKALKKNIKKNPTFASRVSLSKYCISDSCGKMYLSPKPGHEGGDTLSSLVFEKSKMSWKVKSITLQQFILEHSITDCNFIKMDIEGGEFDALPSMSEFLKKEKPTLYLSLHPHLVSDPKKKLERIFEMLSMYNYIYDKQLHEIGKNFVVNDDLIKNAYEIIATDKFLK